MVLAGLLGLPGCGAFPAEPTPGRAASSAVDRAADPAGGGGHPDGVEDRRHLLTGALHGGGGAVLTVSSAAARVNLRATDLPGLLYRISTPADSGLAPRVTGTRGVVRLGLRPTGDDGPDTVDILLNRTVRWQVRLTAGGGEQHLDLGLGRIGGVDLGAGVGLVRLRLPRPGGTVPVRFAGSVGSARIVTPHGVPVRLRVARGAASVLLPWTARADVPPGSVFTPPGWAAGGDRYQVQVHGDLGRLLLQD